MRSRCPNPWAFVDQASLPTTPRQDNVPCQKARIFLEEFEENKADFKLISCHITCGSESDMARMGFHRKAAQR
ncbi:hypothetical protein TNCV_1281011 [Trichonephila clavipes]|nr:hypothetical protein TNCV_1281011 [Trichonephila clavipes]